MGKGAHTREFIIERAAQVFSRRGFVGTSMSDIMAETGLEKGGIYNHFKNKDELALAAFEHSFGLLWAHLTGPLLGGNAVEKLIALIDAFAGLIVRPEFRAGCPVMNTAIDSDDTHPALRDRVKAGGDEWYKLIEEIVTDGVVADLLKPGTDGRVVGTILLTSLEGAVMLTKLYHDPLYMRTVVEHLYGYVGGLVVGSR